MKTRLLAGAVAVAAGAIATSALASSYELHFGVAGLKKTDATQPSCKAILDAGESKGNGTYTIDPSGDAPFDVYCDMDGGGWTRVGYKKDLAVLNRWRTGDAWRWLPTRLDYSHGYLEFTDEQIDAIRSVSASAKQTFISACRGVVNYYYPPGPHYADALGFLLQNGFESGHGNQFYSSNIIVVSDGCQQNDQTLRHSTFLLENIGLPIVNVMTNDSGNSSEAFGAELTNSPAWFR